MEDPGIFRGGGGQLGTTGVGLGLLSQESDSGPFGTGCVNMIISNDPFRRYSAFQNYTHIEWIHQYMYP